MNSAASNPWYLLRSGTGEAAWNMALDAALLDAAPVTVRPVLRFYGWTQPAATFGYFQKFSEIERLTLLRPLVRRPTGGGLVPHDADWTYSAIFPPTNPWYQLKATESYQRIHEWIKKSFEQMGIPTELAVQPLKAEPGQCFVGHEQSDVLWHGRKIAGAAQRRTRAGLLIQGSVQPPPIKIARADWEQAMITVGQNAINWGELQLPNEVEKHATELAAKVYSQTEYNARR